jgi:hypothetical protein
MSNGWTEERRKKQAEAIRKWKPWEKSTGPRTEAGKNISRLNACRHRPAAEVEMLIAAYGMFRGNRDFVIHVNKLAAALAKLDAGNKRTIKKTGRTIGRPK